MPICEKNWFTGNYGIEFWLTLEDAKSGSHQGQCEDDISALRRVEYVKEQLEKLDAEKLKKELSEYGAWDEKELLDHDQNLDRILWIACGNIIEEFDA